MAESERKVVHAWPAPGGKAARRQLSPEEVRITANIDPLNSLEILIVTQEVGKRFPCITSANRTFHPIEITKEKAVQEILTIDRQVRFGGDEICAHTNLDCGGEDRNVESIADSRSLRGKLIEAKGAADREALFGQLVSSLVVLVDREAKAKALGQPHALFLEPAKPTRISRSR
ncbi:MAG TPA: hypothetical protein VN851_20260 [Thermoanaerobaculia bacterium]|nr:hypothetical protein [Thermoanaerobaculia bacterium]